MTRNTPTLDDPALETGSGSIDGQSPLAEAGQEAGESATHLAERAADIGLKQADRGKEQAALGITQVADSIRRVSLDMQGTQPQIAGVAETAADQAERLASYLQETDAREIISTVENAARRQPLIFLGGAFLLGFAASRFIRAAGGGQTRQWSGYRSGYDTSYRVGATGGYADTGYGTAYGTNGMGDERI